MIALLEAHRAGLYARAQWLPNLVADVVVGVVALPLAMAFAIASARPVLTDKLSVCIGCARLMPDGLMDE